jgi:trehalose 6-phosphate synthase
VPVPFAASLGPDVAALEEVAASADARAAAGNLADAVGDRLVIARTDRIDPSKNIIRGFHAFDRLLEARPGLRGRVVFVAMVYPSRQGLAEYLAYENEVEQAVARVNDRWATRDWVPIVLDDRDDFARSVAGMQRYDVLLVNALRDGMNLVAKEGPVVNRRDGVLCLSPETGAYEELKSAAIAVHPYDIEQCAGALDDALSMPLDERAARATRLRALATMRSPADWLADLVRHAGQ